MSLKSTKTSLTLSKPKALSSSKVPLFIIHFLIIPILDINKTDDAILATTSKTYKLQRRLYSNSFLFATKEKDPIQGENDLVIHSNE